MENGWAWINWLPVIKRKGGNEDTVQVSDLATVWRVVCFIVTGSASGGADGRNSSGGNDTFYLSIWRWRSMWKSSGMSREGTA